MVANIEFSFHLTDNAPTLHNKYKSIIAFEVFSPLKDTCFLFGKNLGNKMGIEKAQPDFHAKMPFLPQH